MQVESDAKGGHVIRAAIIGGSGYSGAELMRLLALREDVRVETVTAGASVGMRVDALYPSLTGDVDLSFESLGSRPLEGIDVAFVALPSGESLKVVPALRESVRRVIDLSGDFRLRSADLYEKYYGRGHTAEWLLGEAVYGLPEINAERIAQATLVANPGCYPTSAILGLLPALDRDLIAADGIVVNSLSGVSGAGRSNSADLSFVEVNENIRAYKIGNHQHIPEIQSVLEQATGRSVSLTFIPHLVPITRGIYTTISADLKVSLTETELTQLYKSFYRGAPFVRITRQIPQIRSVAYTNYCDIGLAIEQHTNRLIVISVIDNLVKGAAGQAIQNMNIMFGLPEETGLK